MPELPSLKPFLVPSSGQGTPSFCVRTGDNNGGVGKLGKLGKLSLCISPQSLPVTLTMCQSQPQRQLGCLANQLKRQRLEVNQPRRQRLIVHLSLGAQLGEAAAVCQECSAKAGQGIQHEKEEEESSGSYCWISFFLFVEFSQTGS